MIFNEMRRKIMKLFYSVVFHIGLLYQISFHFKSLYHYYMRPMYSKQIIYIRVESISGIYSCELEQNSDIKRNIERNKGRYECIETERKNIGHKMAHRQIVCEICTLIEREGNREREIVTLEIERERERDALI